MVRRKNLPIEYNFLPQRADEIAFGLRLAVPACQPQKEEGPASQGNDDLLEAALLDWSILLVWTRISAKNEFRRRRSDTNKAYYLFSRFLFRLDL